MTQSKFEKLVNLYLDKEISSRDLQVLKETIKHNLVRKREFKRLCEIHAAERKALVGHARKSGIRRFMHDDIRSVEVAGYSSDNSEDASGGSRVRRRTLKEREKEKRDYFIFQVGSLAALIVVLLVGSYVYMVQKEQAAYARHMPLVDAEAIPLQNYQLALQSLDPTAPEFFLVMGAANANAASTGRMLISSAEGTPLFYISPVDAEAPPAIQAAEFARFLEALSIELPSLDEQAARKRSALNTPLMLPGTSAPASIASATEESFTYSLAKSPE